MTSSPFNLKWQTAKKRSGRAQEKWWSAQTSTHTSSHDEMSVDHRALRAVFGDVLLKTTAYLR